MAAPIVSSSPYLVVVAIDFGTTYSGYAFSFKANPVDVKTNQVGHGHF